MTHKPNVQLLEDKEQQKSERQAIAKQVALERHFRRLGIHIELESIPKLRVRKPLPGQRELF